MTGLIILIVLILVIIGAVVWFMVKNKKPNGPDINPSSGDTPSSGKTPSSGDTPSSGETPSSGDTPDSGDTEPICKCTSDLHIYEDKVAYMASPNRVEIGWYDNDNMCNCYWTATETSPSDNFLSDIRFENGKITAIVSQTNYGATEKTARYIASLNGSEFGKSIFFKVIQDSGIDKEFESILNAFSGEIKIARNSTTYNYLKDLYDEAYSQYYNSKSINGLPKLYVEENFPNIYNFYGEEGNDESAFKTFIGWIIAMQLSELKPKSRTTLYKIGYELGGYDKYSNIYGYKFKYDPNIARLVGSSIYITMRGIKKPDIDKMRTEVGGSKFNKTLEELGNGSTDCVGVNDFFIDFRAFMPTAPGPYAPGYTSRPDDTYPNEQKDENKNLKVDRDLHEYVVKTYNLNDALTFERTVQAIADEEACTNHLFGDNKTVNNYKFTPVYGIDTIGKRISPSGTLSDFAYDSLIASSASRSILQSSTVSPKQYGRLRPGCSWSQEAKKNSSSDDRRNVLCEIDIEDNDGCKDSPSTVGFYNENGIWTHTQVEEDKFCETQKNSLWANSYPSGHSSGIWGASMVLMELMPNIADKIMAISNKFAVNRTIARYHWNSDTINGRVLGSATNAISHASSDYDELLNKSKKEI